MIRLKTLKPLRYGGKKYQPGDVFEAKPIHARLFTIKKKASEVKEQAKKEEKKKEEKPQVSTQQAKKPSEEVKSTLRSEIETGRPQRRDVVPEGRDK